MTPSRVVRVRSPDDHTAPQSLPVSLWATDYREIDVLAWQDAVRGLVSAVALEDGLGATEGRIRDAARTGMAADYVLLLVERTYDYFRPERAEEIRV